MTGLNWNRNTPRGSRAGSQAAFAFQRARNRPTRKQRELIAKLSKELGRKAPRVRTRQDASAAIERLIAAGKERGKS